MSQCPQIGDYQNWSSSLQTKDYDEITLPTKNMGKSNQCHGDEIWSSKQYDSIGPSGHTISLKK